MQQARTTDVQYRHYTPVGDYWAAHSDATIRSWTGLPPMNITKKKFLGLLSNIYDQYQNIHQQWSAVELSTTAIDTADECSPIRRHDLKLALDSLANILQVEDIHAPLNDKLQINPSCGLHLHLSNDANYAPLRSQSLLAAKKNYLKWLRQHRSYEHVQLFSNFYHRSGYSAKMEKILSTNRKEFAINLGIEWRGFHAVGTETFHDLSERITAGIDCFAEAYEAAANSPDHDRVKIVVPITFRPMGFVIKKVSYTLTPLFPDGMEVPCAI
jgi:hypothetical protein